MRRRDFLSAGLALGCRLLAPAGVTAIAGCDGGWLDRSAAPIEGPTMGTRFRVKLAAAPPGSGAAAALRTAIEEALDGVVAHMSTYRPDSELSAFNDAIGPGPVAVSRDTARVVEAALAASRLGGGAFDPTVGPVVDLWGFGPRGRTREVPGEAAVEAALARVGHERVDVDAAGDALVKHSPDVRVDLSGIAKGFSVDRLAELLDAAGAESYLVEVGGELRARGARPGGGPWRIGIERPVAGAGGILRVVELAGGAIATSGDYRNFFERDAHRYSHTIDPRTGRPVTHGLASVSVVAPSAMRADAASTMLMVLGPQAGYELAAEHDIAAHFAVRTAGGLVERWTRAFERHLAGPAPGRGRRREAHA